MEVTCNGAIHNMKVQTFSRRQWRYIIRRGPFIINYFTRAYSFNKKFVTTFQAATPSLFYVFAAITQLLFRQQLPHLTTILCNINNRFRTAIFIANMILCNIKNHIFLKGTFLIKIISLGYRVLLNSGWPHSKPQHQILWCLLSSNINFIQTQSSQYY